MLQHLRQDYKNLVKKYTRAHLSRLMEREHLRKILQNPYQIQRRFRRIIDKTLCNRTRSYRNSMEWYSYSIRNEKKHPMESLSNLENILQDNRQDPLQSYKILQVFSEILITCENDPRVLQTRSYEILQDPTVSQKDRTGSYRMGMGSQKRMKGLHCTL